MSDPTPAPAPAPSGTTKSSTSTTPTPKTGTAPAAPASRRKVQVRGGGYVWYDDHDHSITLPDGTRLKGAHLDGNHVLLPLKSVPGLDYTSRNELVFKNGKPTVESTGLSGGKPHTVESVSTPKADSPDHEAINLANHASTPPKAPATATTASKPKAAGGTPTPPASSGGAAGPSGPIYSAIVKAANENGVPVALALAIAQHESGFDAGNKTGDGGHSWGLYQLLDTGEGAGMGSARLDPYKNASVALRVVGETLRQHPDWSWGQVAAAAQRPKYPTDYARTIDGIVNQAKANPNYFSTALAQHGGGGTGVTVSNDPLPTYGVDGVGAAGSGTAGTGTAPPADKPLDLSDLAAQYGFAAAYLNGIPEIKGLFQKAFSDPTGQWTAKKFAAKLKDTTYYKTHSANQAAWDEQNLTQHAVAQQRVHVLQADLTRQATAMGATINDFELHKLAVTLLSTGQDADPDFVKNALAAHITYDAQKGFHGEAGTTAQSLTDLYNEYGLPVDQNLIGKKVVEMAQGKTTLEDFTQYVKDRAKDLYPTLAQAIDRGVTVKDYASPYVNLMAQTLELDPNSIDPTKDPSIRKALSQPDPKTGLPTAMPLWQFESNLKQDPRWQKTANATDQYMNVAGTVMRDMGLKN